MTHHPPPDPNDDLAASETHRSWPRRLFGLLEMDQAVFFSIAQRVWQFFGGPVTLVLIGQCFTSEIQGYFYTFWSLIALQAYFELALHQTIVTTAGSQWRHLSIAPDGRIIGDASALSRLAYLTRVSTITFSKTAVLFVFLVGTFGYWFFSRDETSRTVDWQAPWLSLTLLTATTFLTTPLLSVLEGCNRIAFVYKLQFVRLVVGNIVVWGAILSGCGLWIAAIATFVRLICEVTFIGCYYRRFFYTLFADTGTMTIDWRAEIWPFQSRMILKGMMNYFHSDFMGPVLFHFHGAVAAGQLGVTWQILNSLRTACSSWVRVRYPRMGILAASGEHRELDRVFGRAATIGLVSMTATAVLFGFLVLALSVFESEYAIRLLPPIPTAFLIIGLVAALMVESLWNYIHSYRVSPYLLFTWGCMAVSGGLTWWWGARFGSSGVTAAFCVAQAGLLLPFSIWARRRLRIERGLDS